MPASPPVPGDTIEDVGSSTANPTQQVGGHEPDGSTAHDVRAGTEADDDHTHRQPSSDSVQGHVQADGEVAANEEAPPTDTPQTNHDGANTASGDGNERSGSALEVTASDGHDGSSADHDDTTVSANELDVGDTGGARSGDAPTSGEDAVGDDTRALAGVPEAAGDGSSGSQEHGDDAGGGAPADGQDRAVADEVLPEGQDNEAANPESDAGTVAIPRVATTEQGPTVDHDAATEQGAATNHDAATDQDGTSEQAATSEQDWTSEQAATIEQDATSEHDGTADQGATEPPLAQAAPTQSGVEDVAHVSGVTEGAASSGDAEAAQLAPAVDDSIGDVDTAVASPPTMDGAGDV